jgi:hypothetical protein
MLNPRIARAKILTRRYALATALFVLCISGIFFFQSHKEAGVQKNSPAQSEATAWQTDLSKEIASLKDEFTRFSQKESPIPEDGSETILALDNSIAGLAVEIRIFDIHAQETSCLENSIGFLKERIGELDNRIEQVE